MAKREKRRPVNVFLIVNIGILTAVVVLVGILASCEGSRGTQRLSYSVEQDVAGNSVRTDYEEGRQPPSTNPWDVLRQGLEDHGFGGEIETDESGAIIRVTRAEGDVTLTHIYDADRVMESDVCDASGQEVFYFGYEYDLGLSLSKFTAYLPDETPVWTIVYTYQPNGLLLRETHYAGSSDLQFSRTYYYE